MTVFFFVFFLFQQFANVVTAALVTTLRGAAQSSPGVLWLRGTSGTTEMRKATRSQTVLMGGRKVRSKVLISSSCRGVPILTNVLTSMLMPSSILFPVLPEWPFFTFCSFHNYSRITVKQVAADKRSYFNHIQQSLNSLIKWHLSALFLSVLLNHRMYDY